MRSNAIAVCGANLRLSLLSPLSSPTSNPLSPTLAVDLASFELLLVLFTPCESVSDSLPLLALSFPSSD